VTTATALAARIVLVPFLAERQSSGHHPRSLYVERFWLPVLGPSTTFLLRHLALVLEAGTRAVTLAEIAAALGLAEGSRREGAFFRCLERAAAFEMVRVETPDRLYVRALLPNVTPRQRQRLSVELRALESELGARATRVSPDPFVPPRRPMRTS